MLETYYEVEKILYVIISVIGVPVNVVAIVILSRGKCGLSTCTTRYLLAMAVSDLLVIIIVVIFYRLYYHYFPVNFQNSTNVCRAIYALTYVAANCSVWFTVTFTLDRFVAICCQKLKTKYCTGTIATFVVATTGVLLCLKNIPFYFAYQPRWIIDNVPWLCVLTDSYYTDPGWVAFDWLDKVLTPLVPFAVILLLNVLTIRHILVANRVRKGLKNQSKGENRNDPEMESRRRSVVLLFTLSASFIFLWLVYVVEFAYYQIAWSGIDRNHWEIIFHEAGYLLSNFSCCTNTFIYAATQSKFRGQIQIAVKYPVSSMLQFMKKAAL
ncbi:probable G-protein coupled receptor 139 [Narcine bancroftii]|uniref:probable G-protein coupled receptor 139 n=1 Tax=Narcine bancroftii TaxID=1343680 RepID=UPI0038315294